MPLAIADWATCVSLGVNIVLVAIAVIALRQNSAMRSTTMTAAVEGVREQGRLSLLRESTDELGRGLRRMEDACSRVDVLGVVPEATLQLLAESRLEPGWGTELKPVLAQAEILPEDYLIFVRVVEERGQDMGLTRQTTNTLQWLGLALSATLTSLSMKLARVENSPEAVQECIRWTQRVVDAARVTSEVLRDTRHLIEAEYRHRLGNDSRRFDGGRWYRTSATGWSLRRELGDVFRDMPLIDFVA